MNKEISVVEIMKEIENNAKKERMLNDSQRLNNLDIKSLKDIEFPELNNQDFLISSKLRLRKVENKGIFTRPINYLLRKFYFALRYLLDSLIVSQEKFNIFANNFILENEKKEIDFDYFDFSSEFRTNASNNLDLYLPFFKDSKNALDLGFGNGEFLQFLKKHNIQGQGVDSNKDFVEKMKGLDFDVYEADLIKFLEDNNDIYDGVFCAQVAEHLDNFNLLKLVSLVFKSLKENSYFIMETINVKSLSVFTNSVYKDLTHIRPIHPDLLRYIFKKAGFKDVSLIFSSEFKNEEKLKKVEEKSDNDKVLNSNLDILNEIIFAPQDYAVVGKK